MGRFTALAGLFALALAAAAFAGCDSEANGGPGQDRRADRAEKPECESLPSESQREECEKAEIGARIPEQDRVAYYQLAITAGVLRAAAVAGLRDAPTPATAGPGELRAARARVAQTDPRDRGLAGVRRQILRQLAAERTTNFGGARARRTLVRLRAIDEALNRYLREREPAQASLIPD